MRKKVNSRKILNAGIVSTSTNRLSIVISRIEAKLGLLFTNLIYHTVWFEVFQKLNIRSEPVDNTLQLMIENKSHII